MSKTSDNVQNAIKQIESDGKTHPPNSSQILDQLHDLQKSETKNGKLDKDAYKHDLAQVNAKLHEDGYLPKLDIISTGEGEAALRALSSPAKSPTGDHREFVTKVHGTTFSYDHQGHVQSWAKGDDKWTYDAKTGEFNETMNGISTGKSTGELVAMRADGTEVITHKDGAQTKVTAWGGSVDTNAQGEVIRTSRHNDIKSA